MQFSSFEVFKRCHTRLSLSWLFCLILLSNMAWGDDTDILFACLQLPAEQNQNLLFVIDDSSSMRSTTGTGVPGLTRWEALKYAFDVLMNTLPSLNAGMVMFSQGTMGGYIAHPISPLNGPALAPLHPQGTASTNLREELVKIIANNQTDQGTSTHGAIEEAIRYLRGDLVHYGARRLASPLPQSLLIWRQYGYYRDDPDSHRDQLSHPASYTLESGSAITPSGCAWSNAQNCADERILGQARYISPFDNMLPGDGHVQIVLMVDGGPAGPNNIETIEEMIGFDCANDGRFDKNWGDDRCLRAMSLYLANSPDLRPDLPGNQTISLSTIAFAAGSQDNNLLEDMSRHGKGLYYTANSAEELKNAFLDIADPGPSQDLVTAVNFAGGATSFDLDQGLNHEADMYFPVFAPQYHSSWPGNLKRYDYQGDPMSLQGQNGVSAFKKDTGQFHEDVKSFWTQGSADGDIAKDGGAASKLPSAVNRKLYTNVNPSRKITHADNAIVRNNLFITAEMFGEDVKASERLSIISWLRGEGEKAEFMGDPLHSLPAVITYGQQGSNQQQKVAFVGTNQGYLHAIDADTGVELWAFMPKALFPNARTQMVDSSWLAHPYGMDGSPTIWINNQAPYDVLGDTNDQIILIIGMRRGGSDYFAFDITDPGIPELIWHIEGGTGDYAKLGQSWSTPSLARVKLDATSAPTDVLILGGGFDSTIQDESTTRTSDALGNAIFMVDPSTGNRLWMASNVGADLSLGDMTFGVPGDVATLDVNGDGLTDQFYAADMGGQVWRFDIDNGHFGDFIKGGRIANLSGNTTANHLRFFGKPDITLTIVNNQYRVAIALGSGSRPTPLNTTASDQFFVLFQAAAFTAPGTYDVVTPDQLTDRTSDVTSPTNAVGWRLDLPGDGEKVLTKSITLANKVIFPTFTPPPPGDNCKNFDTSRVWVMNLVDGKATGALAGVGPIESRSMIVKNAAGFLPQPQLVVTSKGPALMAGLRQLFQGESFGLVTHTWQPQIWEQNQ